MKWINEYIGERIEKRFWRSLCFLLGVVIIGQSAVIAFQSMNYSNKVKSQKLIILGDSKTEVERSSSVSDAYLKSVHKKVTHLMESWTYMSIVSNYKELFSYYLDKPTEELIRANLKSSERFKYVENNEMVSIFELDEKASKHTWCDAIDRACSLVVGTRRTFINNNQLHSERKVAYLIFSKPFIPNIKDEFGLKVTRILIDDQSEKPEEKLEVIYQNAVKGKFHDQSTITASVGS